MSTTSVSKVLALSAVTALSSLHTAGHTLLSTVASLVRALLELLVLVLVIVSSCDKSVMGHALFTADQDSQSLSAANFFSASIFVIGPVVRV